MFKFATVLLVLASLSFATPARAQSETIEVYADSTLAGNDGFLLLVSGGEDEQTLHVFNEGGFIRVHASRDLGSQDWNIPPTAHYLCPAATMDIDDTWAFLPDDFGGTTTARVISLDSIPKAGGTFSAYRVDITRDSSPLEVIETMWFASGVGFVRSQGYAWGWMDWRDDLTSYTIAGGSGFFPLAIGNTWTHSEVAVSADNESWGGIKALYR